jgi:predicted kinase
LVRKELAGIDPASPAPAAFDQDIYTAEWTEKTYAECLRRAVNLIFEGNRVIVDANFWKEGWRRASLKAALQLGVPAVFLLCRAAPDVIRERLAHRRGDASDADWQVYLQAAARWEEPGEDTRSSIREISTSGSREDSLALGLQHLHSAGL